MKIASIAHKSSEGLTVDIEWKSGIMLTLAYVPKQVLKQMGRGCNSLKYDDDQKARVSQFDADKFALNFATIAVKGWKMNAKQLSTIIPLEESKSSETTDVTFDPDNLAYAVKEFYGFTEFIQDESIKISNFKPSMEAELGNSNSSQTGS